MRFEPIIRREKLLLAMASFAILSLVPLPSQAADAGNAGAGTSTAGSPAEMQIERARAELEAHPGRVKSLNALAVALTRRARESGDTRYYEDAAQALEQASRSEPDNPASMRIAAWVAMGRHQFAAAYDLTRRYDRRHGADPWNLSVMGDALMELGRYDEAEKAYQRMVDLKPGPIAYSRVAYLRELRGDLQGAEEMMRTAYAATRPEESEDRAWLQVQVAHLRSLQNDAAGAEAAYRQALAEFPGYHYALAGHSELALRLGRAEEAAALAQRSIDAAPHAERYLLLADALRALDRETEARAAEDTFERLALANVDNPDNENHDLVLYYLERRPDPARALAIARLEATRRQDIHTLDRLAMALEANGRHHEAARLMKRIREIGSRDPVIVAHLARFAPSLRAGR
jgi:tetratricopeptide (TPR) repeat protein